VEVLWYIDLTLPATIRTSRVMIHLQVSREGIQQITQTSSENNRQLSCTAIDYHEVVLLRELLAKIEICCARALMLRELLAVDIDPLLERLSALFVYAFFKSREISGRAYTHGEASDFPFVNRTSGTRIW